MITDPKIRVLFVDDDEVLLQALKRSLRKNIDLVVATGAIEGLRALEKQGPFSVVVSDQNMPRVKGTAFLAKVAQYFPLTVRIMLTGNNDQATTIAAVHEGGIYRFLNKPCSAEELLTAIRDAHAHHLLLKNEREVLEETLTGSLNLLTDMLSLTHPRAFMRSNLVNQWAKQAAPVLGINEKWELDVASKLWPLSYLLLPDDLIQRRNDGEALTAQDHKMIAKAYLSVSQMLQNIPRLEKIARILLLSCEGAAAAVDAKNRSASSELLQILINLSFLVDVKTGEIPKGAFEVLAQRSSTMSVPMLEALPDILKGTEAMKSSEVRDIEAMYLREGDILLTDLIDNDGRLLLASGQRVTEPVRSKLQQINRENTLIARVKVMRKINRITSVAS